MSEYLQQTEDACLAYALYNIGAIDHDQLAEYEAMLLAIGYNADFARKQREWAQYNAPWLGGDWFEQDDAAIPPKGTGVAFLRIRGAVHAVSVEDGQVIDPAFRNPKRQPLEELKLKYHPMPVSLASVIMEPTE